ncbi:RNA polymerase sigma-70 factor [Pedobacter sp. JY14-1]|uniref:RNA polymerase sigma-70 factor n=1 Tax=Pedobacter sp. JY14-1 TaxID=3034151 RepID=UPI0023E09AF1|nr:RNA polymerase sigma-70 factor [Pedobacter sp. JY14-1]
MAEYSLYTDQELVALLKQGDHPAFTELFNRYWNRLLAIAYNHTRDKSDAEEIVQQVFISLWDKRNEMEISQPERYLATAVKFTVFNNYYRKQKRTAALIGRMPFQEAYEIEDEILARFLKEQIDNIVTTLPEKCRLVFKYSREGGMKNREIADEMGISEKTVEAHLGKALKVIKDKLPGGGAMMVILAELLEKNNNFLQMD